MNRIASASVSLSGLFLVSFCQVSRVAAQIIPDRTVGSEVNNIDPVNNAPSVDNQYIRGGRMRGKNLFHSFTEFNININKGAYFVNPGDIKTIFSRVTGNNPSLILGRLGITGGITNPNLFFINPKGIVFGKGASLDINGAFVATTANSIKFPDGTEFRTINPQDAPLLTIETPTPIGLEFVGGSPGAIINAGNLSTTGSDASISLIGGTVVIGGIGYQEIDDWGDITYGNTGKISTQGSNADINLITVGRGSNYLVNLDPDGRFQSKTSLALTPSSNPGLTLPELANVALEKQANTGLSVNSAGEVTFAFEDYIISDIDFNIIKAESEPIAPGDIFLGNYYPDLQLSAFNGARLSLDSSRDINLVNSGILSSVNERGDRSITLRASNDINLNNSLILAESSLGNIELTGNNINLTDNLFYENTIQTNNMNGQSGSITLKAEEQISFYGGAAVSTSSSIGEAGDLNLKADKIILNNGDVTTGNMDDGSTPGNIKLTASQIELQAASAIEARSGSELARGNILIEVERLNLDGFSEIFTSADTIIKPLENDPNLSDNTVSLHNGSSVRSDPLSGRFNGGNISIETGKLEIYSGSRLSSQKGGDIEIDAKEAVIVSGYESTERSRIVADNVNVDSSLPPGNITIKSDTLIVRDRGQVSTESASSNPSNIPVAGNINIDSNFVDLEGGKITASAIGKGNSGAINIYAQNSVELENSIINSTIISNPDVLGNSGRVKIETPNLRLGDRSIISTQVNSGSIANNPSDIDIKVADLDLSNSEITASTLGIGNAGDIRIAASDRISLQNNSSISTRVESGAIGEGGQIDLSATDVALNNSRITASTLGTGDAGNITINASNKINLANHSRVSTVVEDGGNGDGGRVYITAKRLDLTGGSRIETSTADSGKAGDIYLKIADKIVLDGENTGLSASSSSSGNGGNIWVDPPIFLVQNNAGIFVNSEGTGKAGNIELLAGNLILDRGTISARTLSSDGGNIALAIPNLLLMRNGSKISATAGTNQAGGDGGNITINSGFLVANPLEDTDIVANAFTGRGGNIEIETQTLLGFQTQDNIKPFSGNIFLENPTPSVSEIAASSQFGLPGNITIATFAIDPTRGLENLPPETTDVQVSQGCQATDSSKTARFFNLGKGTALSTLERSFTQENSLNWIPWTTLSFRGINSSDRHSTTPTLENAPLTLCP